MSRRRTSSATSRLPSRRSSTTTTTSSKRTRKSRTAPASSRKRSTEGPAYRVYLGLGSNVGARETYLRRALDRIGRRARVERVSSFYRTDPVGHADQRDFVNAVARVAWRGSAEELLAFLKEVESDLGRVARFANGPREIDLDILDFGSRVRLEPDPVLPHPRMTARRFVLAPLAEIAPRWRHPVTGESANALLAKLPATPAAERMIG